MKTPETKLNETIETDNPQILLQVCSECAISSDQGTLNDTEEVKLEKAKWKKYCACHINQIYKAITSHYKAIISPSRMG